MIKEIDSEITYEKTITTKTFDVNGKEVRVYFHSFTDEFESDYNAEVDEQDKEKLTEEELLELEDNLI
jgi:hypothetical protein